MRLRLWLVGNVFGGVLAGLSLFLISCASTPPVCESGNARQAGLNAALQGSDFNTETIGRCSKNFQADYKAGYEEGRRKFCDRPSIELKGITEGTQGIAGDVTEDTYRICPNKADLYAAYDRSFKKGLQTFCSENKAHDAGNTQGGRGLAPEFAMESYKMCGGDSIAALQSAYDRGYHEGLNKFCSPQRAENDGFKMGSTGGAKEDLTVKYRLCTDDQRDGIASSYAAGFDRGVTAFCSPEGILKVAQRESQETASPEFPMQLNVCLDAHPEVKVQYPTVFRAERKKFVESHCTYQGGLVQGRADGETGNLRNNALPAYCDAEIFKDYYEGYLQGWKETKDRICDVSKAYNKGIEDAQHGNDMRYSLPAQCPPEYQTTATRKYREGYYYAKNQPKIVDSERSEASVYTENYDDSVARDACEKAGNSRSECKGVTSLACIQAGKQPYECKITTDFMPAVDECFRKGFAADKCARVKDRECIKSGKQPFLCGNAPSMKPAGG